MKRLLAMLAFAAGVVACGGEGSPRPLLALMEYNAWFPSCGPSFVIYEDGLVIYQSPKEISTRARNDYSWVRDFRYLSSHVENPEAFIRKLFPYPWTALRARYVLSGATDQDTTYLWYRGQIVEIYGSWRTFLKADAYASFGSHGAEMVESENKQRRTLPEPVRAFLGQLVAYSDSKAREWSPVAVDVDLYKSNRVAFEPVSWPSHFPKLNTTTQTPPEMAAVKVALSAKEYLDFCQFVGQSGFRGVAEFAGDKYVISNFTFRVPGADAWKSDFDRKHAQELADALRKIDKLPPEKRKEARKMLGLE